MIEDSDGRDGRTIVTVTFTKKGAGAHLFSGGFTYIHTYELVHVCMYVLQYIHYIHVHVNLHVGSTAFEGRLPP